MFQTKLEFVESIFKYVIEFRIRTRLEVYLFTNDSQGDGMIDSNHSVLGNDPNGLVESIINQPHPEVNCIPQNQLQISITTNRN